MAINHQLLGSHIQLLRKQHGLTQDELSDRAHLAYSTLAKIERGAIKNPSVFTIASIARVLEVSVESLLDDDSVEKMRAIPDSESIEFVYCDINGVLVRFFQRAFVEIAETHGLSLDKIETTFWHYNDAGNRGEMTVAEFDKAVAQALNIPVFGWKEHYLRAVEPIEAMHTCLSETIKTTKVGLLSNIFAGFIGDMIKQGLVPDLNYECIIDSSQVGAIKPESKIYEIAEAKAGYSGSQILFVDDSRTNLMAAERFGWRVLWFDDYRPEESVQRVSEALKP